jgi:hypothetical protein
MIPNATSMLSSTKLWSALRTFFHRELGTLESFHPSAANQCDADHYPRFLTPSISA